MNRCYFSAPLSEFTIKSTREILGEIAVEDPGDSAREQKDAWLAEIEIMQNVVSPWKTENAYILFEYSIPRLGKRIDVVLLLRGIVFVIEFKAGKDVYLQADMEQVMDYALDLKNFHLDSHHRTIVPILVATEAYNVSNRLAVSVYDDKVYNPLFTNVAELQHIIGMVLLHENASQTTSSDFEHWEISRYSPTPTIIQAASAL